MIRFTVDTISTRPINRLMGEHINLRYVRYTDHDVSFSIHERELEHAISLLDGYNITYKDCSVFHKLKSLFVDRLGISVGLITATILLIIVSMFTLDIDINGADDNVCQSINKILEDNNISTHSLKIKDCDRIEKEILSLSTDISYVNVHYRGGCLVIDVRQGLPAPPIEENKYNSIIANCDGIVTRMIVTSGTAMVRVGDSVKRGDILIAPFVAYGEGDEERRRDVEPQGEVYAKTYLEEEIVLSQENIFLVDTGRTKTIHRFGSKSPHSPYDCYSVTRTTHTLSTIVPIRYTTYTYREKEEKKLSIDDDKLTDIALNYAYNKLDARIYTSDKVLKKWFFQKRLDNTHVISVYYEVEKLISGGKLE